MKEEFFARPTVPNSSRSHWLDAAGVCGSQRVAACSPFCRIHEKLLQNLLHPSIYLWRSGILSHGEVLACLWSCE